MRGLSYVFSDRLANWWARIVGKKLIRRIADAGTDAFVELLLQAMDLAFLLCRGFRRNIRDFNARYVFATRDGAVGATADFEAGDMRVEGAPADDATVRVVFTDAEALRAFLFNRDQDILQSVLNNDVEVQGNLNYVFKLGFMARDLERRLGMDLKYVPDAPGAPA